MLSTHMTQSPAIRLSKALTLLCSKPLQACKLQVSRHAGVLSNLPGPGHSIQFFRCFNSADPGRPTCSFS